VDRLKGKVAIISGAAGGQGRVACQMFAAEGARVLATDLDPSAGWEIEALGPAGSVAYVAADVTSSTGIQRIVEGCLKSFGAIDALYNNHGVILGKPFLETTREDWDRIHDIDLKSVYFLTQSAARHMRRGGSVINVSSIGGLVALEQMSAYSAAKSGLTTLSRSMALELNPMGIRVNAICPGVIDTPMPRNFVKDLPDKEQVWRALEERHMMKRLGRPAEVVPLALFLASDESSFMTGSVVTIDGGWTAF